MNRRKLYKCIKLDMETHFGPCYNSTRMPYHWGNDLGSKPSLPSSNLNSHNHKFHQYNLISVVRKRARGGEELSHDRRARPVCTASNYKFPSHDAFTYTTTNTHTCPAGIKWHVNIFNGDIILITAFGAVEGTPLMYAVALHNMFQSQWHLSSANLGD